MAFMHYSVLLFLVAFIGSSFTAPAQPQSSVLAKPNSWDSSGNGNPVKSKISVTLYTRYLTGKLFGSGYNTLVPHGIPINKLLTFSVTVNTTTGFYPPNYTYSTGYGFQTFIDSTYVHINPITTSAQNVYLKPFLIYIVYTS
ncbi:unnamed protein product [Rotaria socialis]|uniref:Uncharacterized protein n=3 Tax=Rotaria TaxID=231623 RepID=A0A817SYD0_9BILA|nr:unnamed protein product [Rotaria socialis]CAF3298103.1 unnamed protein product [Rotaria socialis]CAF3447132.1 unnamed protein product [Rotaria socialis]CAF4249443.1 unnamed protein product [Rotaria socialis]CAF4604662.1 unnamed protein product [Rotaria socialis]